MPDVDIMDRGGDRGLPDRGNLVAKIKQTTGIQGSIADHQVAFGVGTDIGGDNGLTYYPDPVNPILEFGSSTNPESYINIGSGSIILKADNSAHFGQASPFIEINADGSIRLPPITQPSNPIEGTIYQDSSDHHLYAWNGTAWKQLDN